MFDDWDLVIWDYLYFAIGLKNQSIIILCFYLPAFECPEF
jgi:hypothetical protein